MVKGVYYPLSKIVFREFFKAALMPLLFIELALVLLYFSVNTFNHRLANRTLEDESISHLNEIVRAQIKIFSRELTGISELGYIAQGQATDFFSSLDNITPSELSYENYDYAENGVFYKKNKMAGASLYYSTRTEIGSEEKKKAVASELLDPILKHISQANDNIVAVYLNTFDSMNRYYPFIDEVYSQFLPNMDIPSYNFYYLADEQHNPSRDVVWTETYLDPAGQGWLMSCVVPVYNGDFLEGVAGIDITIDKFLQNILNLDLPWGAQAFLVDSGGTIMAMPQEVESLLGLTELRTHVYSEQVARDTFKPEEFNLLKTTIEGIPATVRRILDLEQSVEEITLKSGQYYLAHARERQSGWKLMVLADKHSILEPVLDMEKKSKRIGYFAICFMVLFYILFIFYLLLSARKISGLISLPVVDIAQRSSDIAKGNYNAAPIETSIEELVVLNDNYSIMVDDIRKLNEDLRAEIRKANIEIEERKKIETALRESELALRRARDRSEAASRSKSVFLSNMSHELRTPLNHIIGFSDLLIDQSFGPLNDKQKKYVNNVLMSSQGLLSLINDVLDMAGVDAGEHKLELSKFQLQPVLDNSLYMVKQKAGKKGVVFNHQTIEIPEFLDADERKLKQILFNLLSNAIQFSPEGGTVDFIVEKVENQLKFLVRDYGLGFTPRESGHLFSIFEKEEKSRDWRYTRVGIGLSIVKTFVELHGGTITARSNGEGKGTTLSFTLSL